MAQLAVEQHHRLPIRQQQRERMWPQVLRQAVALRPRQREQLVVRPSGQ
jgi:hypothetical protein